jgi:glycosyltransferase involved in cell wall biosynthesis
MQKLSIIIPVFNESSTIGEVIKIIAELQLVDEVEKEIIIVNDASNDNSDAIISETILRLKDKHIQHVNHPINKGKGGAIQTGIKMATGDYTIIQDADLELNPMDINKLIEAVLHHGADIVYGSRFIQSNGAGGTGLSNLANKVLTGLSNVVFRIKITDMETCYKLVPSKLFKSLNLVEQRFGFEPEITAKLAKHRELKWMEVPISYKARTGEEGKKIGWKDGFRAIWCILKYGLFSK